MSGMVAEAGAENGRPALPAIRKALGATEYNHVLGRHAREEGLSAAAKRLGRELPSGGPLVALEILLAIGVLADENEGRASNG